MGDSANVRPCSLLFCVMMLCASCALELPRSYFDFLLARSTRSTKCFVHYVMSCLHRKNTLQLNPLVSCRFLLPKDPLLFHFFSFPSVVSPGVTRLLWVQSFPKEHFASPTYQPNTEAHVKRPLTRGFFTPCKAFPQPTTPPTGPLGTLHRSM